MEEHSNIHENNIHDLLSFFRGLLIGGMVGSVTMLLVAPQSGKRTRAKIRHTTYEIRDQTAGLLEDRLADTRDKARQISKTVSKQVEAVQLRSQDLVDDQKERLSSVIESGKSAVQGVLSSRAPGK